MVKVIKMTIYILEKGWQDMHILRLNTPEWYWFSKKTQNNVEHHPSV